LVKIITDTTACLAPEIAKKYDIPIVPQIIHFGEESFFEGIDMDSTMFMSRLRTSRDLPKTAAPTPDFFIKEFERLLPLGESILCIHPSTEVSGTVRSAQTAAENFPGADIRILDTRTIGSPLGTMVQMAAEWASVGLDADAIIKKLENLIKRCRLYFLVSTLEYLARGGRIGGAAALMGSVLQIKPILCIRDGKVDQYDRERTHNRAVLRLKDIANEQCPKGGSGYLSIMHADAVREAESLAADLKEMVHQAHIPVVNVPPAIVTHGGPGILSVAFFESDN
jgi:DegV family protein with EDD domain